MSPELSIIHETVDQSHTYQEVKNCPRNIKSSEKHQSQIYQPIKELSVTELTINHRTVNHRTVYRSQNYQSITEVTDTPAL